MIPYFVTHAIFIGIMLAISHFAHVSFWWLLVGYLLAEVTRRSN